MPRTPRRCQWTDAACFHLMDRGHHRDAVFAHDTDRRAFLDLVARYRQRFGFRLYHYCLMDNHVHLLVQLADPRQLSPLMAGLLRAYMHHGHRQHRFAAHLWQGRFKSPAVQCRTYLWSCGRYIERNPVEAGLVAQAWEYLWSSAAAYALGRADALLDPNAEYPALAHEAHRRQEWWRVFLAGTDPYEEAVCRGHWVIGNEEFRRRVLCEHGRPAPRRRGRPPKKSPAVGPISSQSVTS